MKLITKLAVVAGLAAMSTGCALAPTPAGAGLLYTDVKYQGMADDSNTDASKEGRACATNILGLIAQGDATIDSAKTAGGIKKVATVDSEVNSILGLFSTYCTVVRGS